MMHDERVDELIKNVKLGDWEAAERAALEIIKFTEPSGENPVFDALFQYLDRASRTAIVCSGRSSAWSRFAENRLQHARARRPKARAVGNQPTGNHYKITPMRLAAL
jgi:hypothetical protein